ncbi:hypothetical protein LAZ67_1007240 [Cordylochernes scorpioides]|uniref:Endonuclease/exonuclease/phosphatase domain-containing protein n=1 Tax=Cordylochernes scorpioides TaxID=51811 RepID=A0ABY6JZ88_9ARAC|nr:hypothetical protein LAZ67_1007240 [Cordylochernes scorpioides]
MSPKEIYEDMVDTLREDAPSYSTVKKWVAAFKLRRISTEDEHGPGRPVESVTQENIDKIHDLVMLDRRMTVRQIEETLGIPKTTVDRIMREHLGLRKISARWVPKFLTPDQKTVRRKLSSDNLALFEANPEEFVNRFVTMDETWAHHFTPESKQQSITANLFNFECQTFEAIIADTSLDSPEKIQMATKGLILTLVQEAELLLKDAFNGRERQAGKACTSETQSEIHICESGSFLRIACRRQRHQNTWWRPSTPAARVDGEVRDDEICESFRSNHSVQSLLEKREIRVVHRSNNAAHSTSTVFIEVDNQVAKILGQHGRIPVAGLVHRPLRVLQVNAKKSPTVILEIANLANSTQADIVLLQELSTNFFWPTHTAITSIAICLEQSIIVVHSAYWHGLRAADDFIPLLEDTIRRASLPVILGMDTNAHSPTWGIGARLDFRGANLEEFASFNDLHFLGPPVDSTWSNGPLYSSIDVTLASSSLAIHVTRDMVNNETKSSWVESSCKEQTFKSFLNSSLHQNKRRGMLTKGVRFHHDNARPHTARQTTALIEEFEWELVSHPPYSPDVAPSDFHFFPELKKNLGGTQFQDDDELEEAVLGFYVARRQSSSTLGSIKSSTEALRAFRNFKGIRRGKGPMSCYSLRRMIKKFEKTGSLEAKPLSGRASTRKSVAVTVSQNVEAIETLSTYGEVSARQVSRQTGISYGTVWRALRIFLKKYPYKIQRFHELKVVDFEKRQEFAAWVFRQIDIDENWLSNVLWTDEAHFSLNGEVNTKNSRIWATENPRIFTEMPLHQRRVIVWCGFTSSFIIGPFFFEEINGRTFKTVSVTGERYVQLLREKVIPILQDRQALSEITFMQDGGPPHISRGAKQLLKDTFGEDRVISRHFIHQWPSRSPDLTPCDFWLWGYIKSRVYRCRPTTLVMLKASIRRHVSSISSDMLFNAVQSVIYRLQSVFENEGRHIEQGL